MNDVNERHPVDPLDRQLKRLPDLKAPATLSTRVMAAIAARRAAPWYKQSWAHWPPGLRLAFLTVGLAALGLLVGGAFALPQTVPVFSGWVDSINQGVASVRPYLEHATRAADSLSLAVNSISPHFLWWLAALVGVAYATCIGLGTLGYRLILNRI